MVNSLLRDIKLHWLLKKEIHPAEQFIIDLLKNSTTKIEGGYKVWYNPNKEWIIEQELKNDEYYLQDDRVWSFFKSKYKLEYQQIQEIIKELLERHLNCKVATTYYKAIIQSFNWRDT